MHEGFVSDLLEAYDRYGLKPKQVCLEVPEVYFLENNPELSGNLHALKNKGYALRLDNFGSGYASMLYLKDFPLDGISIDKNFVRNVHADKYSRKSVLDILALAKSLDLEVVGEGVESEEQNQFLRENGCHIVQGYLYARAMAREDALTLLRQSRN